jgi:hypothetical protein
MLVVGFFMLVNGSSRSRHNRTTVSAWAIDSNTISNVAFTAACLVVVVVGSMQIRDRMRMRPAQAPSALSDVSPVDISIEHAPLQGDKNAHVAIVEISDFRFPFAGSILGRFRRVLAHSSRR